MKAFSCILFLTVSSVSAQELSYQWVKSLGGIGQEEISYDLVLDGRDYVYISGTFEGIGDFDPGPERQLLTSAGKGDIFVCKLDTNGNLIWVKQFGAEGDDRGRAINLDKNGNIFLIGMFGASMDFDPGFLIQLRHTYPDLSQAEQRLFMLIRLELETREIASVLRIAPDSVRKTRKRQRKKILFSKSESLEAFVMGFN